MGCAVNPGAADLEAECGLLRRKIDAGASFALSQPVFSVEPILRLRATYEERYGDLGLPIFVGVLPLMSGRHAEFLHNEVPGIGVPEDLRERLHRAGERAEDEGLRLVSDLARELREVEAGIYLMPQLGRFDVAAEIVEAASRP